MSRPTRLVLVVLVTLSTVASAQPAVLENQARVSLPETVEFALVVAALTPIGLDHGHSIDRSTPYFREVETHFGAYRTHPAVVVLGAEFNLPRLVGNAADFAFDAAGDLSRVDSSGALWEGAAGGLFARHEAALADFARVTHFQSFYDDHRPVYAALVRAAEVAANPSDQRAWLEANFDARPPLSRVFVSPLLAGHHWTTLYKSEPRIWLSAPGPDDLAAPGFWLRYARKLFTEVSHQYVGFRLLIGA